jgi:hypothetical protein
MLIVRSERVDRNPAQEADLLDPIGLGPEGRSVFPISSHQQISTQRVAEEGDDIIQALDSL